MRFTTSCTALLLCIAHTAVAAPVSVVPSSESAQVISPRGAGGSAGAAAAAGSDHLPPVEFAVPGRFVAEGGTGGNTQQNGQGGGNSSPKPGPGEVIGADGTMVLVAPNSGPGSLTAREDEELST